MAEFKLPTEVVKLPSKGLVYPKDNPLASGEIEMKYMTAKEEDILTNSNYIQQGIVFDKLFESLIVSKINYDDIIVGDKDAIMVAARILGYGKMYKLKYTNPQSSQEEEIDIDLTQLKEKNIDYSLFKNQNEFNYTLPVTQNEITFKLLSGADEKFIEKENAALKKLKISNEITTRLKTQILSVNGERDKKVIREFIDNALLAADSVAL